MNAETFWQRRGPLVAAALGAAFVVLVGVVIFWMLAPAPPPAGEPTASPTDGAAVSPSPSVSPSPDQTVSPRPEPSPEPSPSPDASPSPTASPSPSPTASPSPTPAASPSPTPTPVSGWIEITDFPTYPRSTEVESITAGGPGFVAVGTGGRQLRGRVWTSQDGLRWTAQTETEFAGSFLREVVSVGNTLFLFGGGHEGLQIWRSGDGRSWTPLDKPSHLEWAAFTDVAVVGQTMVAVGFIDDPDGEFGGAAWRSTDGVEWERVAAPRGDGELSALAVQATTLVGIDRAAAFRGSPPIYYSTDLGDSWQPASTDVQFGEDGGALVSVAGSSQRFVAVGYADSSDYAPIAMTSADGRSWTSVSPQSFDLLGQVVALRGGRFLALEAWFGAATADALVSTDGQSWRAIAPLYTNQSPPVPPEGGDEVVAFRVLAANQPGVVVAQAWGDSVRVWFGPASLFD